MGAKKAPRETKNNAYAKFWGDKQRVLWHVMVFSGVVNVRGGTIFPSVFTNFSPHSV